MMVAEAIDELERDWPNYQVWVVDRVVGRYLWCARRWDGTGETLNAESAAGLAELIEAEVTQ
jgi:hypothetical protein